MERTHELVKQAKKINTRIRLSNNKHKTEIGKIDALIWSSCSFYNFILIHWNWTASNGRASESLLQARYFLCDKDFVFQIMNHHRFCCVPSSLYLLICQSLYRYPTQKTLFEYEIFRSLNLRIKIQVSLSVPLQFVKETLKIWKSHAGQYFIYCMKFIRKWTNISHILTFKNLVTIFLLSFEIMKVIISN